MQTVFKYSVTGQPRAVCCSIRLASRAAWEFSLVPLITLSNAAAAVIYSDDSFESFGNETLPSPSADARLLRRGSWCLCEMRPRDDILCADFPSPGLGAARGAAFLMVSRFVIEIPQCPDLSTPTRTS